MTRAPAPKTTPFSIRLTPDERARLDNMAADVPIGAYIKSRLFGTDQRAIRTRAPKADQRLLAQLLARLGQSGLASNFNQLARAANTGALLVDDETRDALNAACADVAAMRTALMQALGARGVVSSDPAPSNPEGPQ